MGNLSVKSMTILILSICVLAFSITYFLMYDELRSEDTISGEFKKKNYERAIPFNLK